MKKEWLDGYKVVGQYHPITTTTSCATFQSATHYAAMITLYELGQETHRPKNCGPLAVFKTLKDAVCFLRQEGDPDLIIFSCKYTPSKDKSLWKYTPSKDKSLRKYIIGLDS